MTFLKAQEICRWNMISSELHIVRNNLQGYILIKFGNLHSFYNIKYKFVEFDIELKFSTKSNGSNS